MKIYLLALLSFIVSAVMNAQSEESLIRATLQQYIDGTSYNNPGLIKEAFYKDADLFLSKKDQEVWIVPVLEYCGFFEKREKGKFNGRTGNILTIDQENDIAMAKAEILIPSRNLRYIDIFLLKRINGHWKIISKAATLVPEE
ncbi:MAG: nuclear transport factor 2 family protein [Saonia sp.]